MKSQDKDLLDQEMMTSEEAIGLVVKTMVDSKNANVVTDLDENEIKLISALEVVAVNTDNEVLTDFCRSFKQHRISKNRMGRSELLEIAKGIQEKEATNLKKLRNILHI